MFKVGLISLFVIESNGIRYLASALREGGFTVDEFYFGHFMPRIHHRFSPPTSNEVDALIDLLRKREINLVGISLRVGAFLPICIELTQRIKSELNIPVIWGGAHVTMAPEQCVKHPDLIVLGESDKAICEIADRIKKSKDYSDIQNIWTMNNGVIIQNPLRPLVKDLDELSFPDFHSTKNKFWLNEGEIKTGEPLSNLRIYRTMASRGCPYNCSYCSVNIFKKRYNVGADFYRKRSVENLIEELQIAKKTFPHMSKIRFDDELFVLDRNWIESFSKEYSEKIGLPFDILSNPLCIKPWYIEALKSAGLKLVFVGIEGPSEVNKKLYQRTSTDHSVIDAALIFRKYGIKKVFQVIVDDPMTEEDEKSKLLDLLLKIPRPYDLMLFSLCHQPGSDRTAELLKENYITESDITGNSDKVLHQYNADFSYPRNTLDNLYLALYLLANKRGVPRFVIRRMERSAYLRKNPSFAIAFAKAVNMAKLFMQGFYYLASGEISIRDAFAMVRKLNFSNTPSI